MDTFRRPDRLLGNGLKCLPETTSEIAISETSNPSDVFDGNVTAATSLGQAGECLCPNGALLYSWRAVTPTSLVKCSRCLFQKKHRCMLPQDDSAFNVLFD